MELTEHQAAIRPASRQPASLPPASPRPSGADALKSLRPLAVDVGVPLGTYYLLHAGLGLSLWLSLALSSVVPAIRSASAMIGERQVNLLAALMLAVNGAGIAVSFASGDPRALIAKDSLVSSVIAIAILGSVLARRPLMSAGLKPYLTKGSGPRTAAWDRLTAGSRRFRRLELAFSLIWGVALLTECAARLIGAFTLPVTTMAWLGTTFALSAIGLAVLVGGIAAAPMQKLIDAEAGAR